MKDYRKLALAHFYLCRSATKEILVEIEQAIADHRHTWWCRFRCPCKRLQEIKEDIVQQMAAYCRAESELEEGNPKPAIKLLYQTKSWLCESPYQMARRVIKEGRVTPITILSSHDVLRTQIAELEMGLENLR